MRLGFDGKRATRNFRGLGNYSRGIVEGLLDYTTNDLLLYTPPVKDKRAQNWLDKHQSPRLQVCEPATSLGKLLPSYWRSFSMIDDLEKDNLDLYHGLSHEIPFGISRLSLKKVVTIHDLIFLRYPEFFPFIDRLTYRQKFKYSCDAADMVIAICEQTKNDLIHLLKVDEEKIFVHYQSCDPAFYDQRPFENQKEIMRKYHLERPFILCVGAFEERKNQLRLIEAFAKKCEHLEQDLVLIGNGKKYLEECKLKVNELRIENRVRFLSNVPFADLPLFYQAADLFCFPSHFEGFGLPIVESLFSKTPVITSFGSCFPESAGPDSVYVDPNSVEDISDKIEKVLNDVTLQETMISKGYSFVQKFHRENVTKNLTDCYSQLF